MQLAFGAGAGIVTETEFEGASPWGKLPAWISSPIDGIASRRRSSSTRSGFTPVHTELPRRGGATG